MFRGARTAEERAASHAEEQRVTEATLRAREVLTPDHWKMLIPFYDGCLSISSKTCKLSMDQRQSLTLCHACQNTCT